MDAATLAGDVRAAVDVDPILPAYPLKELAMAYEVPPQRFLVACDMVTPPQFVAKWMRY